MALFLLALIYNECASPVAAILSSIESLKQDLGSEVYNAKNSPAGETKETGIPTDGADFDNQKNPQVVLNKSRAASAGDGEKEIASVQIHYT